MYVGDRVFPSVEESREAIENWVFEKIRRRKLLSDKLVFRLTLSLEEAVTNAIRHGNKNDPNKEIRVGYVLDRDKLEIRVTDEGEGFTLNNVPNPTADENLEKPLGRGIHLMRTYADEVVYSKKGNSVKLCYFLEL